MYLPYLRARQFELIALRELVEKNLIDDKILPIIEPIKFSSTFMKTIETFIRNDKKVVIIHNPQVGNFIDEIKQMNKEEVFKNLLQNKNIIVGHIINENSPKELEELRADIDKGIVVINNDINYLNIYANEIKETNTIYTLIPDESVFKRRAKGKMVLLADRFKKKDRNSDYSNNEDEIFAEDHLYYAEELYDGFSDYSIIGSDFSESGFAPYAVAIHIVYFDDNDVLRVKHFVSDSNDDIRNPAGKFYEAVKKLYDWSYNEKTESYAIKELRKYYETQGYPGLGTVKKLSLMHHIEIIHRYLNEVN